MQEAQGRKQLPSEPCKAENRQHYFNYPEPGIPYHLNLEVLNEQSRRLAENGGGWRKMAADLRAGVLAAVGLAGRVWCEGRALIHFPKTFFVSFFWSQKNESLPGKGGVLGRFKHRINTNIAIRYPEMLFGQLLLLRSILYFYGYILLPLTFAVMPR
ncbi:hypothetical protein [Marinoscillum sp. 108]|uniref:hypothetical protein n=1 Tax=Marinoscillum sp. 108 TaxID=2653151 RepID=UPI0012F1CE23|nr:hypothetical protein [Marinoscillum sp. 108]VXD14309.1 hypothetical protein MARINOS108_11860 [Marinoscillum sp. 108]